MHFTPWDGNFKEFQLYGTYWHVPQWHAVLVSVIAPLKNSSYMGRTDKYLSDMQYLYLL